LKEVRIKQRDRELDQKDTELEIKKMYYQNKSIEEGKTNNNIVVTDRESIMRFLEGKKQKELPEEKYNET
jgi:hypothetical protein